MKRFKPRFPLYQQIIVAVIAGVLYGIFLPGRVHWVAWMGDIFLRLLKMVAIPLVFFLITSSIAGAGKKGNLGVLGLKALLFYCGTTLLAILTGIALVSALRPGAGVDLGNAARLPESVLGAGPRSVSQILIEIVPDNPIGAFARQEMLAIVFMAVLLGAVLSRMRGEKAELLVRFFEAVSELLMKITELVIKTAPLGIFAMIAAQIGQMGGDPHMLAKLTESLGIYLVTVISGLGLHMFVTMSVILLLFRLRPFEHLRKMFLTLITGFSTATSNATIPVSLKLLEEEGVSKETASFVVPLGATVNMNGTSLYECVVVLFLAQAHGIEMDFVQMATIVLTALLSAIGTAGIPMASLVMITIILGAVGLPLDGLGIVLIVDRFLDMLRTVVNVYGDTCCAVCIAKTEGEELTIDRRKREKT
ncbi:MAG: dicarboxylate/amino acid:cation symporter [Thermoguttaceae bacterium]|nr:dicarboxylate/amino acid:cation symporter [Thermoguttaceae bacterium]